MSYTLGIPISQQRRANKVLRHDLSEPIDFEVSKQDKDFYIFTFNVDYDEFKKLVVFLKSNGVTTIGADKQLTERKIMKLTRLIEQDIKNGSPGSSITGMEDSPSQGFKKPNNLSTADDIIDELKYILKVWETKEYNSDKERYEEYYMDIEDLRDELQSDLDGSSKPSRDVPCSCGGQLVLQIVSINSCLVSIGELLFHHPFHHL